MRVLIVAALAAGCYRPTAQPCTFACSADQQCPDTLACNTAENMCAETSTMSCLDRGIDAAAPPDVGPCMAFPVANLANTCDPKIVRAPSWHPPSGTTVKTSGVQPSVTDQTPIALVNQLDGTIVAVIEVGSLTIDANTTLVVESERPSIILVEGDAHIEGTIEVQPHMSLAACADNGDGEAGQGMTGGGGGGFGTPGGNGGRPPVGGGGGPGTAATSVALVPLRGGCDGGKGAPMGAVGGGGGALQISVHGTLTFGGVIDAGGGGGEHSANGGHGGGSGGGILVEAHAMMIVGGSPPRMCANGGAGGGAGSNTNDGPSGACASTLGPALAPAGVPSGGNGAAEHFPVSSGTTDGTVGGGGGGGLGRIRIHTPGAVSTSLQTSPAYTGQ